MFISVIMLTYNRREYMNEMIHDVLSQDYTDFEFIIVNNGCSDGSEIDLKKIAEQDQRIKIITLEQPNSIGKARNIGARESRGDYIAYVDDDDRIDKDYLSFLMELYKGTKADIVMCGCDEFEGTETRPQCVYDEKIVYTGEEAVIELLKRKKIRAGLPTKIVKRELILRFPFVEDCSAEDTNTAYKYYANAKKVVGYGLPKYHIRRHSSNISGYTSRSTMISAKILEEYLKLYSIRAEYLKEMYPDKTDFWDYIVWSFLLSMSKKIMDNELNDCAKHLDNMITELKKNKDAFEESPYIQNFEVERLKEVLKKGKQGE